MSTQSLDQVFENYFNEAKKFLEEALSEQRKNNPGNVLRYCRAAFLIGFSSLEAYINSICDDYVESYPQLSIHEKGFLSEVEVALDKDGSFSLTEKIKFNRLEDKILFIYQKFSGGKIFDRTQLFWGQFSDALKLRNNIVHPKSHYTVSIEITEKALRSILEVMNYISLAIHKSALPLYNRGLQSK